MINRLLVLLSGFCLLSNVMFSQSTVCAYKYRKRIAFDPAKVIGSNDLANYPALIRITSDVDLETVANGGHVENANGFDIIFTSDDGVTKLDHQLEKYTATTGELVTWVRIPNLSTSLTTYIYMYYGNTAITTSQSLNSTWSSFYKGVYHFHTDFNDKSGNGNNGTNNSFATAATGTIANAISSNNINDYVSIGTTGWSTTNGTYEMWINNTGAFNAAEGYFLGHTSVPAYANRIQIYAFNTGLRVGLGGSHAVGGGGDLFTFAANRWYHVALMYASGNYTVCVNGATVNVGTYTGLGALNTDADVGNDGNPGTHNEAMAAGALDNMFIQNTTRDVSWITTVYNNQSSPSTFYTISAEPKVWNGGNTSNYNSAVNWLGNSAPSSGNDVIINNGTNQPLLQGSEQVNSIFIRTGATLSLGANNLSVRSDITNCGVIAGNTGMVTLNSAAANIQNQNLSGSGTFSLNNLAVNNTFATSPAVILNKDVNVYGALTLTSGIVYTSSTNILALGTSATSGSGSAGSFVSGPMSKDGNASFVFPVGKGSLWRRIRISNISGGTSVFRAEYFNSAYTSTTPVTSPLNNVSTLEFWQLDRMSGSSSANVSLYWENAGTSGITDCPDLTVARWNGSSWVEMAATTAGGSSCTGAGTGTVVTTAAVSAFSPFTFGSKLTSVNPLPIELLQFTAVCKDKQVTVNWSTATETNNDHFLLEKSPDGSTWTTVSKIKGGGRSNTPVIYSYIDRDLSDAVMYYRLVEVDGDGNKGIFGPISSNCASADNEIDVYPNPASSELTVKLNFIQYYGSIQIKLIDNLGRTCQNEMIDLASGKSYYTLPLHVSPGTYTILFFCEGLDLPAKQLLVK